MPERVIDGLEAIQIDEQHRQITAVSPPVHNRIAELLVEQQPIAKARQCIVVRQVRDRRLRSFALLHFALKLLIGLNQILGTVGNTALERLVCPGKLLVHVMDLLFRALSIELRDHAGERNGEVDRLGDVIIGAAVQRINDVFALALGGNHDDRQGARRVFRANLRQDLEPGDVRHHDVQQDKVESLPLDQIQCCDPTVGLGRMEAMALEATPQNLAIFTDIVDDEKPRPSPACTELCFSSSG